MVVSRVYLFFLLTYFFGNSYLHADDIGRIIDCETSTMTYEYVKCKPSNKVFEVIDILQDGWIAVNNHSFYVTFKKVKNFQKVMMCLESNRFPNYLGNCKSDDFDKPKTWLREDAIKNGWKFTLAIGDTVYYVQE
ncbi:MAG: hypothetical protein C0628_04710 [Sulfurimonas sp.]|uniref:hypothetical protein n=1 Tax=uncultured Arcobacter sp. TaxID=165434 RepID=UPI000CC4B251|nr:hypothetical protein [uncultured Arcobacter sp.]PLY14090.1 MAG: hypothetical protein C0628_04710 [Sulfurimonas sp.]